MRKLLLLPLLMSMLVACSVDNDELMQEDEFGALNAQAAECTVTAGDDNIAVYTNEQIDAMVDDFGTVTTLYLNLLDEGVVKDGTFNPSLHNLFRQYKRNPYGDFTTTYTVAEGECMDSTDLTISICEEIFDAGSDQSVSMTEEEVNTQVDSPGTLEALYLDLLDEGVDQSGSLNPTAQDLLRQYNGPGTYTTTYSLGEGNCGDTAELTIIVTE